MIDVNIYFTIYDGYSNSPSWSKSRWVKECVRLADIPNKGDWVTIGEYLDAEVVAVTYHIGGKVDIDLGRLYAGTFSDDGSFTAEQLQKQLIEEIDLARRENGISRWESEGGQ